MKGKKILLLAIIAVAALGIATSWYFKRMAESFSQADLPKFELPEFETFLSQETKEYTEFITPDGKLKLNYPSNWVKMDPGTLDKFNQSVMTEGAESLLFAQGAKLEKGAVIFLMVQKFSLEKDESLEEFIENAKGKVGEGVKLEISNLKIEDETAYFEGRYEKDGSSIYSKEKLILSNDKIYSVIALSISNSWSEFEEEVNNILNSVEILS